MTLPFQPYRLAHKVHSKHTAPDPFPLKLLIVGGVKGRGGYGWAIQQSLGEPLRHDFMRHNPTRFDIIEPHERDPGVSHSYSRPEILGCCYHE